ncbi:hypothetical protein J6590_019364 [Homalodisca vitripennis]|nr:hypothetical protein J6590_019364 [Homalodisca vitripennis]
MQRSFSKLKLIKNRLRDSMSEHRLNVLASLGKEIDILRPVNHEDTTNGFIAEKLRRKPISKSD